jgi:hypothetical protein
MGQSLGMKTMGLAGKMQRAAAYPTHVMILAHQSPAAFVAARNPIGGDQQRLICRQDLTGRHGDLACGARLLRKVAKLPVGFALPIIGCRMEMRSSLENQHREAALAQAIGHRGATCTATDDHDIPIPFRHRGGS